MNIFFLYERSFKTLLLNVSKFWTHDFQGRSSLNVDLWNDWQPPVFLDKNLLVRKCISNIINSYNNGKIEPLWEVGNGNVDGDGRWGSQVRQSDILAIYITASQHSALRLCFLFSSHWIFYLSVAITYRWLREQWRYRNNIYRAKGNMQHGMTKQ